MRPRDWIAWAAGGILGFLVQATMLVVGFTAVSVLGWVALRAGF